MFELIIGLLVGGFVGLLIGGLAIMARHNDNH